MNANQIKESRIRVGLSQAELAKKIGVSRPLVSMWDRNKGTAAADSKGVGDGIGFGWAEFHVLGQEAAFSQGGFIRFLLQPCGLHGTVAQIHRLSRSATRARKPLAAARNRGVADRDTTVYQRALSTP